MAQLTREALKDQFESFKRTHHVSDSMDDLIDSVWNMVDDGEGGGSSVKTYAALLTQTGTSAPVVTVGQNTFSGSLVWSRSGVGIYVATLSGAFSGVTISTATNGTSAPNYNTWLECRKTGSNTVELRVYNYDDGLSDDKLTDASILIMTYS